MELSSECQIDLTNTLSKYIMNIDRLQNCFILGIVDLNEVFHLLKGFNSWKPLGLELGITYPTLEEIELKRRECVTECKMDVLACWLKNHNGPTYQQLIDSLTKLDENALACEIKRKLCKRKCDEANASSSSKRAKHDTSSQEENKQKRIRDEVSSDDDITHPPTKQLHLNSPDTGHDKGPYGGRPYKRKGTKN